MKRIALVLLTLLCLVLLSNCPSPGSTAPTYTVTYNANATLSSGSAPSIANITVKGIQ